MKVEDARQKLERIVNNVLLRKHTGIMVAADAYGDARELRGHLGKCRAIEEIRGRTVVCGTNGWYCPDAPVKEVTHDD